MKARDLRGWPMRRVRKSHRLAIAIGAGIIVLVVGLLVARNVIRMLVEDEREEGFLRMVEMLSQDGRRIDDPAGDDPVGGAYTCDWWRFIASGGNGEPSWWITGGIPSRSAARTAVEKLCTNQDLSPASVPTFNELRRRGCELLRSEAQQPLADPFVVSPNAAKTPLLDLFDEVHMWRIEAG